MSLDLVTVYERIVPSQMDVLHFVHLFTVDGQLGHFQFRLFDWWC